MPPRVLQEIAEFLGRHRRRQDRDRAANRTAFEDLADAVGASYVDAHRVRSALAACGLGDAEAYTVVVAALKPNGEAGCGAALREALQHLPTAAFAVADRRHHGTEHGAHAGPLRPGVSAYGRPSSAGVAGLDDLDGLRKLMAGIPADVRNVYRETTLGPLVGAGRGSGAMLLETLEAFLANDCSWARTAEALHIHVNTVHYRVERIETLTGRDLSRLDHRVDLHAALLCR
ncbi:PucR family transcriptional regulator [Streptomyces sp. NPDC013457]|uniref:PucR family transcriptional regulator n=1 Tax=Streptomyces sp. NPDC013457 TaxID=3364866 RepID=UPI0036F69360